MADKPASNVYTILALVALLSLGAGIGVLWYKNIQLTGEPNPLYLAPEPN